MNYFTKEELEEISTRLIESPTRETLKELNDKYNKEENVLEKSSNEVIMPSNEVVNDVPPVVEAAPTPIVENNNMWDLQTNIQNNERVTNEPTIQEANVPEVLTPVVETPAVPSMEIPNALNTPIDENQIQNPAPEVSSPVVEAPINNIPINNSEAIVPESSQVTIPSFSNYGINTPSTVSNIEGATTPVEAPINNIPNNEPIPFNGNLFEQNTPNINLMQTTDNFNAMQTPSQPAEDPLANIKIPVGNEPFFSTNPEPVNSIQPNDTIPQGPSMFGQFEQNYM